jgi:hypothetical protein
MRITYHASIKSTAVHFSHENHLVWFDQILNCQIFTWESLVLLWSNLQLSIFHMRITCYALIKSSSVNFSHENHLLCFNQIPICQFILLWSNPQLSIFRMRIIYITLIKSPRCQFFIWESLILLWLNPQMSIFRMRIIYITLIKSPRCQFFT